MPPFCRHCQKNQANATRGLCKGCYRRDEVRSQYPPHTCRPVKGKNGDTGGLTALTLNHELPLPPEPTSALPGSEEKIRVMQSRLVNGFAPCHPRDGL